MHTPSSKLPNLTVKTEEFIDMLDKKGGEPLYKLSPEKAREFLVDLQKETYRNIPADVKDIKISDNQGGEIDVRIVRPENNNDKLPAILYIHGGGWVLGDKETFDMLIKTIANCANAAVIFPEYSRSPEAKFPKALNEIYTTLEYIAENSEELNINPEKIAIAGDSAGGNMATVTALRAAKNNGPKIVFEALFYPVTNADMDTQSYENFKEGPWLTKKAMEWFFNAYLGDDKKKKDDIYVSPLKAELEDLSLLPPTLILTDENDVLRDEAEAYARKLDEAGVEVANVRINGTHHDFFLLNALYETAPVKTAFIIACKELKQALHK